jgi:lysozyme family protein
MADARTAFLITTDPAHEGGFQTFRTDKGNWTGGEVGIGQLKGTNWGISAREFPTLDIKNLTREQAIEIYIEKYWGVLYNQITDQAIASKLADLGVLFGQGTAIKALQRAIPLKIDDGIFGLETLAAVNAADPIALLIRFKRQVLQDATQAATRHVEEMPDLQGWSKRINS